MLAYIIFFAILILGLASHPKKGRIFYLIIVSTVILIIMGLRDVSVGVDTDFYVHYFLDLLPKSWSGLEYANTDYVEPFYSILTWLIGCFTDSYQIYLFLFALIPVTSIFIILKNETERKIDIAIAFIILFDLGLFAFFDIDSIVIQISTYLSYVFLLLLISITQHLYSFLLIF